MSQFGFRRASLILLTAVAAAALLAGCAREESLEGEVKAGADTRDRANAIQQESQKRASEGDSVLDNK